MHRAPVRPDRSTIIGCVVPVLTGYANPMPETTEAAVVDLLSRVDRLWAPIVRWLGRAPEELPSGKRAKWWADTVSRYAAAVSATPRFAGKLADLIPLQDTVGVAVQSLVVLGVARENGLTDADGDHRAERIALLSRVLLNRPLTAAAVQPLLDRGVGVYVDDVLGSAEERSGKAGVIKVLLRVAGTFGRIDELVGARPKGGRFMRLVSMIPVVGVVGGYFSEQKALHKAAAAAQKDLLGRR